MPYTFHQLEYGEGENISSTKCGGPPDEIKFPFHGIFISARLDAQVLPHFGVDFYIPAGRTARLSSNIAKLNSITPTENEEILIKLSPYNGVLKNSTDLMKGKTTKQQYLFGVRKIYEWYPFGTTKGEIILGNKGRLILPDLYIDRVLYHGPSIPYHKVTVVTIDSLNC